jgi:hypothetical protein
VPRARQRHRVGQAPGVRRAHAAVVQPLDAAGADLGDSFIAVDNAQAGPGDRVLVLTEGNGVRQILKGAIRCRSARWWSASSTRSTRRERSQHVAGAAARSPAFARDLHARGWVANHDGNVSARDGAGFLATPTATSKRVIADRDMLTLDAAGKVVGQGKVFGEIGLHLAVYQRRPDVGAVIHAHPPHATAIACAAGGVADHAIARPFIAEALVSLGPDHPADRVRGARRGGGARAGALVRERRRGAARRPRRVRVGRRSRASVPAPRAGRAPRAHRAGRRAARRCARAPRRRGRAAPRGARQGRPRSRRRRRGQARRRPRRAVRPTVAPRRHRSPSSPARRAPHSPVPTMPHGRGSADLGAIVREEIVRALRARASWSRRIFTATVSPASSSRAR